MKTKQYMENVYYTLCTSLYVIITFTYNYHTTGGGGGGGGGGTGMPMLNRGGGKIWAKAKKRCRDDAQR
jgi:hypothetical protein